MKHQKVFAIFLILALAVLGIGLAFAAEDPVVGVIEISPDTLAAAGDVNVKITVSNAGDEDLPDPVYLYTPQGKLVDDFGDNGAVMLGAGESKTWEGTYAVNTRTLEDGKIVYYVMYTTYDEDGQSHTEKQPLSATIKKGMESDGLTVERVISPSVAKEGQEITVKYSISNKGETSIYNIVIKEHKDINNKKNTIPELKSGSTADVTYTVKMGKKSLTSAATITYSLEQKGKTKTYNVPEQKINLGEPKLSVTLTPSAKGVIRNGTVTLTLMLKNSGTVGYSDIRVSDPVLGEVFSGEEVAAGKTLKLEKEVTVPETMDFVFTVKAVDETGSDYTVTTDKVTVTAVNEDDILKLDVKVTPDRTLVYETPGRVRFTFEIHNPSNVDAKSAVLSHGTVTLSKIGDIKAGETVKLTRDTLVSTSGRMRFTVTAYDPLGNQQSFDADDIQIVLTAPTQAPSTPTPPPVATAVPTAFQATYPPIGDPSIASGAKTLHKIITPIAIICAIVAVALILLLIVAKARRIAGQNASNKALDHLERSERRDYSQKASNPSESNDASENDPDGSSIDPYDNDMIPDGYRSDEYDQDEPLQSKYAKKPDFMGEKEPEELTPAGGNKVTQDEIDSFFRNSYENAERRRGRRTNGDQGEQR